MSVSELFSQHLYSSVIHWLLNQSLSHFTNWSITSESVNQSFIQQPSLKVSETVSGSFHPAETHLARQLARKLVSQSFHPLFRPSSLKKSFRQLVTQPLSQSNRSVDWSVRQAVIVSKSVCYLINHLSHPLSQLVNQSVYHFNSPSISQ